jgi:hypothetical protein
VNAITQLRFDSPGSLDPALLFAAVHAFPQSLAVVDSGTVLYVNLAWAQMFEYTDPSQIRGRPLGDFVPGRFSTLHWFHTMTLCEMTLHEMTPGETIPAGLTGERFAPPCSLCSTGATARRNSFKWFVPTFECEGKNFRS